MKAEVQVKHPKTMALILMLGAFIGLFGETALNMGLTNVMQDFSISAPTAQWLTTGYLLVLAILVPISAYLTRWFTTRQLVLGGFMISIIGTFFAAISPVFAVLLLGRVIQAIGTGIILPVMMTVMLNIFPVNKRGVVMGIMGLVITLAPAVGPTLSGVIITTLNWHFIFWFSAIFYVGLTVIAFIKISNVSEITKPKIDFTSIILSTIGFSGLIYALSTMAEVSISSPIVWLPLVIAIISLTLFCVRQTKMSEPMLNLTVFKHPMFTLGVLMIFFLMLVILSTAILLPIYLKGSLLLTAALAGLVLLPGNAINFILSPVVGSLFDKYGARYFGIAGYLLLLVASIGFSISITATTPVWLIISLFIVLFLGSTMIMMPAQTNGLNQLPPHLYADGSAAMNTLMQVAGSAGTALAITLYTVGQQQVTGHSSHLDGGEIIAHGVQFVFYFITGVAALGFITSLFVKKA
ncbi:DHA2 family efflux MFS transporter permease subunit [Mammaliicoccus sp. Dog046]|uniref:DHA2 family efflux MFS transporter permease subunit n=1 Tax=Mammaliicoccus sp. Dog046 TaxID=3034233 RepID=UPI002B25A61B|nr:DHA2 family efflux MFS transporter permease subunit [Mammaliicoccus sp. Dog046]WQK85127.1 DHA2 family efflux MFS transporter permease subunit [Mammaliicoccus sp. Dog046]